MKIFITTLFTLFFLSLNLLAITYNEVAEVTYKKFKGDEKQEVMDKAFKTACLKGLKKYVNTFDDAKYQNYRKVKNKVEDNFLDYLVCDFLDDDQLKKEKKYIVKVRVEIFEKEINALLIDNSTSVANNIKSGIALVIFALQVDGAKSFDIKDYQRSDTSNSENASQIEASDGVETISNSEVTTSETSTTGGSNETKSDIIQSSYSEKATEDFLGAFTEKFTMTNFELTDVYMLFDDDISDLYDEMKAEIEDGGQPKQRTKAKIIGMIQKNHEDIGYVIYGKVYLGQKEIDQSTGNTKIVSQVNGEVWNITERRPKLVSSVSPAVFAGLGSTLDVARTNALKQSSESSSKTIINILSK
jgi:hypothetical protein